MAERKKTIREMPAEEQVEIFKKTLRLEIAFLFVDYRRMPLIEDQKRIQEQLKTLILLKKLIDDIQKDLIKQKIWYWIRKCFWVWYIFKDQ